MLYDLASYISCMALCAVWYVWCHVWTFLIWCSVYLFLLCKQLSKLRGLSNGYTGSLAREILKLGGCHVAEGEGLGRAGWWMGEHEVLMAVFIVWHLSYLRCEVWAVLVNMHVRSCVKKEREKERKMTFISFEKAPVRLWQKMKLNHVYKVSSKSKSDKSKKNK